MPITLIVEDGSGLTDANAFAGQDFVSQYHADRGHISWASVADESQKACIIRATDYITKRFGESFRGYRAVMNQSLPVPRAAAIDKDGFIIIGVPLCLQQAMAEYALRAALYSELAPDPLLPVPTQDFTGAGLPPIADSPPVSEIVELDEKVGPLEEKTVFQKNIRGGTVVQKATTNSINSAGLIPEYPAADMLIERLLKLGSNRLIRA